MIAAFVAAAALAAGPVPLLDAPRAGPLRLAGAKVRRNWTPFAAAVDGDRVVVEEFGVTTAETSRLRLYEPGAAPRVLPWGRDIVAALALAGEHVAFGVLGSRFPGGGRRPRDRQAPGLDEGPGPVRGGRGR